MKKKIAVMLVGLMCVSATGCSLSGNKGVDLEAISAEDIFTNVSEDAVVDGATAAEAFTNALNDVESSDNITINVSNKITMGAEGDDSYQDSVNKSVIKLAKEGENKVGSVVIDNIYKYAGEAASGEGAGAPLEEKSKITGYYSGESLYFTTNDGDKVKEDMAYEDFLSVVNTYTISIYNDCISKAACVEGKNDKTYYISYDPAKFETTMNTNMEASGQTMADGESMNVKYANIIAKVDNENKLLSYGFLINAEYVNDDSNIPYNYSITAEFSNIGNTKVDVVTDTDSYMTAEEYTKKMQEEATYAADASIEGESAVESESGAEESTN